MSKSVYSPLLFVFLEHCRDGHIGADDQGHLVLSKMRDAANQILAGDDPYAALEVKRTPGAQKAPHTHALARFIHHHKYQNGEKWAVVEQLANEWLSDNDLSPVSLSRLKKVYREHAEVIAKEASYNRQFHASNDPE